MTTHDSENIRQKAAAFIIQEMEIHGDDLAVDLRTLQSALRPPDWRSCTTLENLEETICECRRCGLAKSRCKFVFGNGAASAEIVLVGEAPGATEDQQGVPFVGEAGRLLDKILASIQLKREEVFTCNVLKCRPPENRDPQPGEVAECLPYLRKQLELIQPTFILCLGRHAAQTLLDTTETLSNLRGRVHTWQGIRLIVTYHPAALLRYPQYKPGTWEDVKLLRRLYDDYLAGEKKDKD
jgi:uracil-DNA glycosylase